MRHQLGRQAGGGGGAAAAGPDSRARADHAGALFAVRAEPGAAAGAADSRARADAAAAAGDSAAAGVAVHRNAARGATTSTSDPLSLREVTYRFAQADNRLDALRQAGAPYIHTPTLMMLSGRDRIVTNSRCRAFLGRIGAAHKTLIEYPERGPHARIRNRSRPLLRRSGRLDRADGGDVANDGAEVW